MSQQQISFLNFMELLANHIGAGYKNKSKLRIAVSKTIGVEIPRSTFGDHFIKGTTPKPNTPYHTKLAVYCEDNAPFNMYIIEGITREYHLIMARKALDELHKRLSYFEANPKLRKRLIQLAGKELILSVGTRLTRLPSPGSMIAFEELQ